MPETRKRPELLSLDPRPGLGAQAGERDWRSPRLRVSTMDCPNGLPECSNCLPSGRRSSARPSKAQYPDPDRASSWSPFGKTIKKGSRPRRIYLQVQVPPDFGLQTRRPASLNLSASPTPAFACGSVPARRLPPGACQLAPRPGNATVVVYRHLGNDRTVSNSPEYLPAMFIGLVEVEKIHGQQC